MNIAWTGHRPDLFLDANAARLAVQDTARELVQQTPVDRFLVGGQRGVDTWAAQAAIDLHIPFTLYLPYAVPEFTAEWTTADRQTLERHVELADAVRIARGYRARNRMLAAEGDLLIAVWTGRRGGGTAETLDFARQLGKPVREIRLAAAPVTGSIVGRGI